MIPRLDISFSFSRQCQYWCGRAYKAHEGEYLLNHARTGIILALRASLPQGGRVGVVAYNCHTVANAVVEAGCKPIFVDVTQKLCIDIDTIPTDIDAIVVTNLFGVRNNVEAIREACPRAVIIVDNAHGYGLPAEGDYTVYSINQGKFPSLGEGGILYVAEEYVHKVDELYETLPSYGLVEQVKLFVKMLAKAIAYSRCCYWIVMKIKNKRNVKSGDDNIREQVRLKQMAPGVRRIYRAWLPKADAVIAEQKQNAAMINEQIQRLLTDSSTTLIGENAFMLVVRCMQPEDLMARMTKEGVETATHFRYAIEWARVFGYIDGSCPTTERLTRELIMIPTYRKITNN